MRVTSLEIAGFRAFAESASFDLDADAVILAGPNGQGKTSLLDAILWAIAGEIPRIGGEQPHVVSAYSKSSTCRVLIRLTDATGMAVEATRSFDGTSVNLTLKIGDSDVVEGTEAQAKLAALLWPNLQNGQSSDRMLTEALTRSVYLQQDLVREFIEADTEQERFRLVGELIGIGRLADLQARLERERKAWSEGTRTLEEEEVSSLLSRISGLKSRLESLITSEIGDLTAIDTSWVEWWGVARKEGVKLASQLGPGESGAAALLDEAVKQLQVIRDSVNRQLQTALSLLEESRKQIPSPFEDFQAIRAAVADNEAKLQELRRRLDKIQQQAVADLRQQARERENREELAALARLALRHLEERCPVCSQKYDKLGTRKRLEQLANQSSAVEPAISQAARTADSLAKQLADLESKALRDRDRLHGAEVSLREWTAWTRYRNEKLTEMGLQPSDDIVPAVQTLATQLKNRADNLTRHVAGGEQLALMLAKASELARRQEVDQEVETLQTKLGKLQQTIQTRMQAWSLASSMIDALREASMDIVERQLRGVEPLLQRIYSTIDPHPTFRATGFLVKMIRGHGQLSTAITDPLMGISSNAPGKLLSSSQMNALAVAVFLAMNLGLRSASLETVMLDDPLQALDDVNLLGLIDLLRRTREQRQLLVVTHDREFAHLLERKLRPVKNGQRTRILSFQGWTRSGPTVRQRDVATEERPMALVV